MKRLAHHDSQAVRSLTQFRQVESERNRRIAEDMTMGETTRDLSDGHRVSPGRISQPRREFERDWYAFADRIG